MRSRGQSLIEYGLLVATVVLIVVFPVLLLAIALVALGRARRRGATS
jgi:hypothetical protein